MRNFCCLFILGFILITGCSSGDSITPAVVTKIGTGADEIPVIVVSGTAYEMGLQLGEKLGKKVGECISNYLNYAYSQPEIFNAKTLDAAWEQLAPFIDKRIKDELKGLSEGSGVPLKKLQRAHAVPALADYACSGIAIWGKASSDGHLYHLRNLDFIKDAQLQKYPVIVIYKPRNGFAHAMATFAGYVGAHSGMNAQGIVLGEKGESPAGEAPFNINGLHFTFLFRQILYDAQTLQDAVASIEAAPLIKRYFFYVSDGKPENMGAVKFRVSTPDPIKLQQFKDNDASDDTVPVALPNCIYYTMDNDLAANQLQKYSGNFDAEKMIQLSRQLAQKGGNLLNVVYDATALRMWIAYAENDEDAASRSYVELPLHDFITGQSYQ